MKLNLKLNGIFAIAILIYATGCKPFTDNGQGNFHSGNELTEKAVKLSDAKRWCHKYDVLRDGANLFISTGTLSELFFLDSTIIDGVFLKRGGFDDKGREVYFMMQSVTDKSGQTPENSYMFIASKSCVCEPCCDYNIVPEDTVPTKTMSIAFADSVLATVDSLGLIAPVWISRRLFTILMNNKNATGIYLKKGFKEMILEAWIVWARYKNNTEPPQDWLVYEIVQH